MLLGDDEDLIETHDDPRFFNLMAGLTVVIGRERLLLSRSFRTREISSQKQSTCEV